MMEFVTSQNVVGLFYTDVVNIPLNLIAEIHSTIKLVIVISERKVDSNIQLFNSWFPTKHRAKQ